VLEILEAIQPKLKASGRVMTLAWIEATRFYASRDGLSGWVVRNNEDRSHYSDPLPNRNEAIKTMIRMYNDTIDRHNRHYPNDQHSLVWDTPSIMDWSSFYSADAIAKWGEE
jgi:hypothetical protein